MEPLTVLPIDLQRDFMAAVIPATPTAQGAYRLVAARRTEGRGFQGQRITVLVVDENGVAMPGVPVAFSFSTADQYLLTSDFAWTPPAPHRAFIVRTEGGGQIDMVLGAEGVVKAGQAGGVAVYILDPAISSDVVTGAGMLANHDGMHLTYQLRRTNVTPQADRLSALEAWVTGFDERLKALESNKPV